MRINDQKRLTAQLIIARGDNEKRRQLLDAAFPKPDSMEAAFGMGALIVALLTALDTHGGQDLDSAAQRVETKEAFSEIIARLDGEGIEL